MDMIIRYKEVVTEKNASSSLQVPGREEGQRLGHTEETKLLGIWTVWDQSWSEGNVANEQWSHIPQVNPNLWPPCHLGPGVLSVCPLRFPIGFTWQYPEWLVSSVTLAIGPVTSILSLGFLASVSPPLSPLGPHCLSWPLVPVGRRLACFGDILYIWTSFYYLCTLSHSS